MSDEKPYTYMDKQDNIVVEIIEEQVGGNTTGHLVCG